jgi:hypothetical protein
MSVSGKAVGTLRQPQWHIAQRVPLKGLVDFMAR